MVNSPLRNRMPRIKDREAREQIQQLTKHIKQIESNHESLVEILKGAVHAAKSDGTGSALIHYFSKAGPNLQNLLTS